MDTAPAAPPADYAQEPLLPTPDEAVEVARRRAIEAGAGDPWTWVVFYRDGWWPEYSESDRNRGWATVEKEAVVVLMLVPLWQGLNVHSLRFDTYDGRTPVMARRFTTMLDGPADAPPFSVAHIIGWEKDGTGSYQFFFGDGSSVTSSDFNYL
jgi:hypothetical protein